MTKFGIEITEVVIDNLKEGVFYAKLITVQNGIEHAIDSRTSDAVALALRAKCNIYTYKNILDDAGVEYENQDDELDEPSHIAEENVKPEEQNSLSTMTVHQLNNELEKAIQVEDYDRAALLRDVINTRK